MKRTPYLFLFLFLFFLAACGRQSEPQSITLAASEFHFDNPSLTVQAGRPVTLHFANQGQIDHALALDEWNLETETLRPGQSADLTFTPKTPGSYTFYCALPGHLAAGMTGTITVTN